MQDKCFTYLRTISKLGYVVFCFDPDNENIGSFQILVQSEAYDGEYVYNKINEFLVHHALFDVLFNPPASSKRSRSQLKDQIAHFIEEKKAILRSVLEHWKDSTLTRRTSRLWFKISHGQLTFNLLKRQIQLLSRINIVTLLQFYLDYILKPKTSRKMVIVVNGKGRNFHPKVTYPLDYANLPEGDYPAKH